MSKEQTIFLLGGHDLEMLTIRDLLEKESFTFFDHKLKWGAKLSSYKEELQQYNSKTIYGIELIEDITPPKNYHAIDHHNEHAHKVSSLEQVLELLGKEPTREHKLISANDVGHIEAMKCIGATDEEIKEIRQRERAIQGVTKEDELQAQKEIASVEEKSGVYIIDTVLDAFSPIVDNFEKRPLLVYSQKDLTYYGDISFLKEHYKEQLEKNEAYHGRGYFGFDSKYVGSVTPNRLVEEILEMKEKKKIISYHNFMFPFRFDKIVESFKDRHEFYKNNSFDDRVKIDGDFHDSLEKDGWEYQPFSIKTVYEYNELTYFHDFVRDTLFNTSEIVEDNATSYYFFKSISKTDKFELAIKDGKNYLLNLVGLSLRIFDTGVALLSLELENKEENQDSIDDILKINDFGRRVYPQYLGENLTQDTKGSFLADSIKVIHGENIYREDFDYKELPKEIKIADYLLKLLGENTFTTKKSDIDKFFIQPSVDDRMFVVSWYGNHACSEALKDYNYIENSKWYEYVFVDGKGRTVQSPKMQKRLIEESTYDRWMNSEYGLTLYGMSRYSFVCLSSSDFPLTHMKTIYFQMFTLLLVQRASILRFSDEVTAISDIESPDMGKNITNLYKNYIRFVNKLYFREVTPQDQGLEMYNQARKILNIDSDIKDLDNEIEELHKYASMLASEKISELGAVFLPPTLLAGIYGMNIFDFNQTIWDISIGLVAILLVAILGYISIKKPKIKILMILTMLIVMVGSIVLIGQKAEDEQSVKCQKIEKVEEKK